MEWSLGGAEVKPAMIDHTYLNHLMKFASAELFQLKIPNPVHGFLRTVKQTLEDK